MLSSSIWHSGSCHCIKSQWHHVLFIFLDDVRQMPSQVFFFFFICGGREKKVIDHNLTVSNSLWQFPPFTSNFVRIIEPGRPDWVVTNYLGTFWKPLGTFFSTFIYCWAGFGQKFYLVAATLSQALYQLSLFHKTLGNFLFQRSGCPELFSSWFSSWPFIWIIFGLMLSDLLTE